MAAGGFRLCVCGGPDSGRELVVTDPGTVPIKIGRQVDPERDLVCSDRKVSRRHATIEVCSRGVQLTDCGSTNKTRHNNRLLEPGIAVLLRDGDELRFGPDTIVRFEVWSPPAADRTTGTSPSQTEVRPAAERQKAPDAAAPRGRAKQQASSRGWKATPPAHELPLPNERFGKYAVYDLLGESDTDRVDVAVDTERGERIALKRFTTKQLSRRARKSLLDSAARGRRWHHPNIAEVLDAGEHADTLYVASRLVEGMSLTELQTRYGREIDIPLAAYIVREVCAALQYAQEEEPGFVHRNVSPRTIMLGRGGEVVLINFGFVPVKVLVESTAHLSAMEARYLSPEHRAGRGRDPRSDIFSVGIVLYELLAQEPIDPRRKAALPDVDTVRPEVSPLLAELTMRAVALRPEQRFQSAAEMHEEVAAALDSVAPGYRSEAAAWMAERFSGFAAA